MIAPMFDAVLDEVRKVDDLERARFIRTQIEKVKRTDDKRATLTMRDGSKVTGWIFGGFAFLDVESGSGLGIVSLITTEGERRDYPYLKIAGCAPAETPDPGPIRLLQAMLTAYGLLNNGSGSTQAA